MADRSPPGRRWRGMLPDRRALGVLVVTILCLAATATVGSAAEQVIGRPTVELFSPDNEFTPGADRTLSLQIANEGSILRAGPSEYVERVTTARATTIEVTSGDTPIEVHTGRYAVGTVPQGTAGPIPIRITVPEDTPVGTYQLPVRVRYTYTRIVDYGGQQIEYTDRSVSEVQQLTVRVESRPRFEVVSANTSARVGDRGTLSVALRNVGTEPVDDARIRLTSLDGGLTFGGDADVSTAVGRWPVGEVRRVQVPVDVAQGAPVRPYAVNATVEYVRSNGADGSKTYTTTVTPRGAPSFSLASVDADLRVGGRGTIAARVENTGETTARDAVVRLDVPWANRTREDSVGDLEPGEVAEVGFTGTVPATVDPGRQRVTFRVDHAAATGARTLSDPFGASVDVLPRRRPIAAEPVDATFAVDESGRLDVRLTNRAGEPVTDLRVTIAATDPLSSDDPAAYVPRLADGESRTVSFHLDVSEDAVPGEHPVSLSFAYDDADGTARRVSDVPVGVTVVEPSGPGFPVEAALVVVLAALAGGVWWWRRR